MQINNYQKKYSYVIIAAALMLSFSFAAAFSIQAASSSTETLNQIEKRMWGETFQMTVERRVERLENQLYGQSREGEIDNRLHSLADYVLPDEAAPSLEFLLSYLENYQTAPSSSEPIVQRLNAVEEKFGIQPAQQAVVPRLHQLFAEVSHSNNNTDNPLEAAPTADVTLEPGMDFRARLETSMDSGRSQTGKLIDFTLEEDFIVDNVLVLPAGTDGRMRISSRESAGYLGRDGNLSLQDHSLHSLDGKRLRFGVASPDPEGLVDSTINFVSRHRSRFFAAGAGVAGALILDHPGGLIFSFAVPGREERYQQGEVMQLEITRHADVFGIPLDED